MIQQISFCLQRGPQLLNFKHNSARDPQVHGRDRARFGDSWLTFRELRLDSNLPHVFCCVSSPGPCKEVHRAWTKAELNKVLDDLEHLEPQCDVPSIDFYRSLLKACTKLKDVAFGKRVHAHVAKQGVEFTKVLGEHIVSMLVVCGCLNDAVQVLRNLPRRTAYSWTAVIYGYTRTGQARYALRMYNCMRDEGLAPNRRTFISLIKACSSLSDLGEARRFHAEALWYGWDSDLFVGTSLVDMYAKCGSIVDAQNVFDGLSQRDVVSWNALLLAYALQGEAEKALRVYARMADESVMPNDRTFVNALQACSRLAEKEQDCLTNGHAGNISNLARITAIHADAKRMGFETDGFVGSSLVSLYSTYGNILDARRVFDKLCTRDVVSWTVMLAAYVKQGQPEDALHLYRQMSREGVGVTPNGRTFLCALQACAMLADKEGVEKLKYLEEGKAIHKESWKRGYTSDLFINNTLLSMYGKFGSVGDAINMFDKLPVRDVISWNALLAAYTQQGEAEKVLMLYQEMLEDGMSPNDRTFVNAFQVCSLLSEAEQDDLARGAPTKFEILAKVKALHAEALRRGYSSDLFVANTLINMYGKCGSSADAQSVFDVLQNPDIVSWNSLITAHSQVVDTGVTWRLYRQMMEEGETPDVCTFVSMLQVCGMPSKEEEDTVPEQHGTKMELLEKCKLIHAEIRRRGYHSDLFVANSIVSMYGKCGSIADAQMAFDNLSQPDVVSWNAILAAYIQRGEPEKTLTLFGQMQQTGVSTDARTLVSVVQAWGMIAEKKKDDRRTERLDVLGKAKVLHAEVLTRGYHCDVFVTSALLTLYGKCGSLLDARCLFDGLANRDVVSWTSMLSAYVELGHGEKALQLFNQMQMEGVTPSDITLVCILRACSSTGILRFCRQIHDSLVSCGRTLSPLLANTLIHAFGRCGSMVDAQSVFNEMPQPNVVSWTALIAGYAREGNSQASLQCFEDMQRACSKPNAVTFLSLLAACSHSGLVGKGVEFFESMSKDFGITPGIEHYCSLVDLLGRAGHFTSLQNLILSMPVPPDLSMCLCLMAACRKNGKVALARETFDAAIALQPKDAAAHVLMSSIYAEAGLWEQANDVNEMRQTAGASKEPGESWIANEQEVHTFAAEDCNHAHKEQVYRLLDTASMELWDQRHDTQNDLRFEVCG